MGATDAFLGKVPPHSLEAERAVLGACLLFPESIDDVSEIVRPSDFYKQTHDDIFAAMLALQGATQNVDLVTLGEYLQRRGELQVAGGHEYLSRLVDSVVTRAGTEDHANIVASLAVKRAAIGACLEGLRDAYDGDHDGEELIAKVSSKLDEAGSRKATPSMMDIASGIRDTTHRMDAEVASREDLTGITTGFYDLDGYLSGMQRKDLIILAGRPSMGKTALAVNILVHAAKDAVRRAGGGKPEAVAGFSLEMSRDRVLRRALAIEGEIPAWMVMNPKHMVGEKAWDKLARARRVLAELPVYIDDGRRIGVREVRTRARRLHRKHPLCLVIVDYLQIMQFEVQKGQRRETNRTLELGEMTASLRALAGELDCPVLLLSQLNRATEARGDKRPQLADLRESGSIEQDADVVAMLHREHYYDSNKDKSVAEVLIRKNRNGSTGTVVLAWDDYLTRFRDAPSVAAKRKDQEQQELKPWDDDAPLDGLPF